ncbi:hypothetical protein AALC16_21990 [Lachnospiraceae bacterium 29-91]
MKEENEKKKEYLKNYLRHVRRIHRINEEIREIRSMRASISLNTDGMPHGSVQEDLSGYAAELDAMERDLIQERYHRIRTYQDIAGRIKRLSSENEKDVLFYRYIKGLDWWEIAEKMRYSERQVHRFHGKALAHIRLPENLKDVIECQ